MNAYGVAGGAFLAKANMGSQTITLDGTSVGRVCVSGTVDAVPTPADGSHPPYSDCWGIELGFNLNQGTDRVKTTSAPGCWTWAYRWRRRRTRPVRSISV